MLLASELCVRCIRTGASERPRLQLVAPMMRQSCANVRAGIRVDRMCLTARAQRYEGMPSLVHFGVRPLAPAARVQPKIARPAPEMHQDCAMQSNDLPPVHTQCAHRECQPQLRGPVRRARTDPSRRER